MTDEAPPANLKVVFAKEREPMPAEDMAMIAEDMSWSKQINRMLVPSSMPEPPVEYVLRAVDPEPKQPLMEEMYEVTRMLVPSSMPPPKVAQVQGLPPACPPPPSGRAVSGSRIAAPPGGVRPGVVPHRTSWQRAGAGVCALKRAFFFAVSRSRGGCPGAAEL